MSKENTSWNQTTFCNNEIVLLKASEAKIVVCKDSKWFYEWETKQNQFGFDVIWYKKESRDKEAANLWETL